MEKRRIVFRADGSGQVGYGHFIRSLALAGYIKDDFDCQFTTYNAAELTPSEYQLTEISKVCGYFAIAGDTLDEANADFLSQLRPGDIVVLDNYYYTTEYQQAVKDRGCKLVCIDDVHDRHMVCDLLMTPCPLRRSDFSVEPYTRFAGGVEWAFLREPFLRPSRPGRRSAGIRMAVLAMGGADPFRLTDKMITVVREVLPQAEIHVMAGDSVAVSDESAKAVTVHRRLSAEEIVELFDSADFGVFPASTVCIEAMSRRLPVAVGYYVDNQAEFYKYGVRNHLFSPLGCLHDDVSALLGRLRGAVTSSRPEPPNIDFSRQKQKIIHLFKQLASESWERHL